MHQFSCTNYLTYGGNIFFRVAPIILVKLVQGRANFRGAQMKHDTPFLYTYVYYIWVIMQYSLKSCYLLFGVLPLQYITVYNEQSHVGIDCMSCC